MLVQSPIADTAADSPASPPVAQASANLLTNELPAEPRGERAAEHPPRSWHFPSSLRAWSVVIGALLCVALAAVWIKGHAEPEAEPDAETAAQPADLFSQPVVLDEKGRQAAGIELAPATSRQLAAHIDCLGHVDFNLNYYVQVRPRVEGIVRTISTDVGQSVEADQVLAVVDSAALGDLKAAYLNDNLKLRHWKWQSNRQEKLGVDNAIPEKVLHETRHSAEEAKTELDRATQQLANLGIDTKQLDEIVETNDTSTLLPVLAPWAGAVVERLAVEGEAVTPSKPLFALAKLDAMWAELNVNETDFSRIALDQAVQFTPDGLDRSFAGKVVWISPTVDPRARTLTVRVELKNVDRLLKANMFGHGRIRIEDPRVAVVAPRQAVQRHAGKWWVFTSTKPGVYEPREVRVGVNDGRFREIVSGLKVGERVVTSGSFLLLSEQTMSEDSE